MPPKGRPKKGDATHRVRQSPLLQKTLTSMFGRNDPGSHQDKGRNDQQLTRHVVVPQVPAAHPGDDDQAVPKHWRYFGNSGLHKLNTMSRSFRESLLYCIDKHRFAYHILKPLPESTIDALLFMCSAMQPKHSPHTIKAVTKREYRKKFLQQVSFHKQQQHTIWRAFEELAVDSPDVWTTATLMGFDN